MPTGSVIVGRASSSELSDHGMRCLVVEDGSVEVGVSTLCPQKLSTKLIVMSVSATCTCRCYARGSDDS